jgi:hypothetical protein
MKHTSISLLLWLLLAFLHISFGQLSTLQILFTFCSLILVPLTMELTLATSAEAPASNPDLMHQTPFFALFTVISCLVPAGIPGAFFSSPWLVLTASVAFQGSKLVLRGLKNQNWEELLTGGGSMYLLVGGAWFFLARAGISPLHFSAEIVMLTALHFHVAAYVLPIFVSLCLRKIGPGAKRMRRFQFISSALLFLPAVIGLGITFDRTLEGAAALLFAFSIFGFVLLVWPLLIPSFTSRASRVLIMTSLCALSISMALGIAFAAGRLTDLFFIPIDFMAMTHGFFNTVGFGGLGLWAFRLESRRS